MATKKKAPKTVENGIHVLSCKDCGEQVSGPDLDSVAAVMVRHHLKTGHGKNPPAHEVR